MEIVVAKMKVIALDPGVTTGYAVGNITEDGKLLFVTGQEKWNHLQLWEFLIQNEPDVIISERFEFRNKARTGLELFSRELIGVMYLYGQMRLPEALEPVMQMPSVIGGFFNDVRLRREGIYKEANPHANDASRHLLHWFQFAAGFQYNKEGYEYAT